MPQLVSLGECRHCPRHTWEHSGNELRWENLCGTLSHQQAEYLDWVWVCNLLLSFFSVIQVSWTDSYFIQAVSGTSGLLSTGSEYLLHCKMEKQTKTTFRKIFFFLISLHFFLFLESIQPFIAALQTIKTTKLSMQFPTIFPSKAV